MHLNVVGIILELLLPKAMTFLFFATANCDTEREKLATMTVWGFFESIAPSTYVHITTWIIQPVLWLGSQVLFKIL